MTTSPESVLVVDDAPTNVGVLLETLEGAGFHVTVATDGSSAIAQAERTQPALILLDVLMPGMDGYQTCRLLKEAPATQGIPVIFMTALDDLKSKIHAFELGAVDYITKPFRHEEVVARVSTQLALVRMRRELELTNTKLEARVVARTAELGVALDEVRALKDRLQAENAYLQEEIREHHGFREFVGSSSSLLDVIAKAKKVAPSTTSVLICGETGTGKELIARTVHEHSHRADRPLVKLNCAAISGGLVESELFGHVKGAFTGAANKRAGRFELADGGTLFLDEVSELPLETQAKLLRVLQEQEFEAVGSSTTVTVDVRIIAATNRDLPLEIKEGRFRADLFYRLNVFPLEVPPLRHRDGDVDELSEFFLQQFSRKHQKSVAKISVSCMERLRQYSWPGNVRDLQNVIERAVILCDGRELLIPWPFDEKAADDLACESSTEEKSQSWPVSATPCALHEIERQHLIATLKHTRGVIDGPRGAAALLELKPSTARFRIKKLGIDKTDYLS